MSLIALELEEYGHLSFASMADPSDLTLDIHFSSLIFKV